MGSDRAVKARDIRPGDKLTDGRVVVSMKDSESSTCRRFRCLTFDDGNSITYLWGEELEVVS